LPVRADLVVGLGCQRLDDAAVVQAALGGGVRLFDTADVYGAEPGDGERLLAAVVGDRDDVVVATKVGLTRPAGADGRWVPDGRARALTAAAEVSLARLGRRSHDLLFLHAPDPRVPLATSVRALAALRAAGVARAIGVANVSLRQLDDALAVAPLDALQVRFGPSARAAEDAGVLARARERGVAVFAHTPLGGVGGVARLAGDADVAALALAVGCTVAEAALLWIVQRGAVPLPGARRVETARSVARVIGLAGRLARAAPAVARAPAAAPSTDGEVVLLIGPPGAGKSTAAAPLVEAGYQRLNRDLAGGTLAQLAVALEARLAAGGRRFVLDNTYATRRARAPVIAAATRHGLPVRCVVLATTLEDAQVNACERLLQRHGRLLEPAELDAESEVPPRALFRHARAFEAPELAEGLAVIESRPFVRTPRPERRAAALIVELDGLVWRSRSGARAPIAPDDVELLPGRAAALARAAQGSLLLGTTWQPGCAADVVAACAARLADLLGRAIDVEACRHPGGPPVCWCRKPLPGLGVVFQHRHQLDAARTRHVGASALDRTWAARLGFAFTDGAELFADE
jgi:aryl-alcohol dehydrogenase-like predicted oxidoreductase/predicted kinase